MTVHKNKPCKCKQGRSGMERRTTRREEKADLRKVKVAIRDPRMRMMKGKIRMEARNLTGRRYSAIIARSGDILPKNAKARKFPEIIMMKLTWQRMNLIKNPQSC